MERMAIHSRRPFSKRLLVIAVGLSPKASSPSVARVSGFLNWYAHSLFFTRFNSLFRLLFEDVISSREVQVSHIDTLLHFAKDLVNIA